jgi:acyl carrier protein
MDSLLLERRPAFELERRIQRIFREQMRVEVPDVEADLFEAGALDSLSFVDLLLAFADEFGIEIVIEELELEEFRTIRLMASLLAREGAAA